MLFLAISLLQFSEVCAQTFSDPQIIFLNEHFADRKYEIWEEKLIAEGISFTTAVHYIDPMKRIIDEAVVYTVIDDKVVPYLFFKPDKILNGKKLPIIDLSKHPYDFYGWQLEYSYPKNKK